MRITKQLIFFYLFIHFSFFFHFNNGICKNENLIHFNLNYQNIDPSTGTTFFTKFGERTNFNNFFTVISIKVFEL